MANLSWFTLANWACWAGAERFDDGRAPLIAEVYVDGAPATLIVHGPGLFLDVSLIDVEDDDPNEYPPQQVALDLPEREAVEVARRLPERVSWDVIEALGFRPV